jgi:hypothetical protein
MYLQIIVTLKYAKSDMCIVGDLPNKSLENYSCHDQYIA